jgi:hypothetical protein
VLEHTIMNVWKSTSLGQVTPKPRTQYGAQDQGPGR